MDRKRGIRVIVLNLLLFAALYGLVTLNKALLRPNLLHIPAASILTGCFPNFIAAYVIGLAFVNGVLVRNPRRGRLIVYASSFVVFAILAIEELKPMWGASTYYDPYDILASGLGSLLAVSTYEIIALFRKHRRA